MIIKNLSAGQNLEATDKTWEVFREEGAIIEEALEDDDDSSSTAEKVDEKATSPADPVIATSFDEKSGGLHGYQEDVVDVHPNDHPAQDENGQGLL